MYEESKGESISVTGHGDLYLCEMLRMTRRLENWLTDSGEAISFTHRQRSTPHKHIFLRLCLVLVPATGWVDRRA
jgi:hypothetical protein